MTGKPLEKNKQAPDCDLIQDHNQVLVYFIRQHQTKFCLVLSAPLSKPTFSSRLNS